MVPLLLGTIGWLCSGPLVATLIVGRTGAIPSLRWLLTAIGAYVLLGAIGVASEICYPEVAGPSIGKLGWRRRVAGAVQSLAATAGVAGLLPALYVDDASYHLTRSGEHAPATALAALVFVLAQAGAGVRALVPHQIGERSRIEPSSAPLHESIARAGLMHFSFGSLTAGLCGVVAMLTLNQALFLPVAEFGRTGGAIRIGILIANLACLLAAAAVGARAVGGRLIAGLAFFAAWICFAPLSSQLAGVLEGPIFLLLAVGFWLVARNRVPASASLALVVLLVVPSSLPPANAPWPAAAPPRHNNVSLSALYSRLYASPGALTGADAAVAPAAGALAAGTLITGLGLVAWWVHCRLRSQSTKGAAAALALVTLVLLLPRSFPEQSALAATALIPLASALVGPQAGERRWRIAAVAAVGYVLAGTSTEMLLRAGTEILSAWPVAVSLPALGLTLLAVALAITPKLDDPLLGESLPEHAGQ